MHRLTSLSALALLALLACTPQLLAQKNKNTKPAAVPAAETNKGTDNAVVLSVGSENITFSELEAAFRRNMNRKNVKLSEVPRDSVMDFVKLYTNYRLKVMDALSRKVDQDSAVKADIEQNRRLLAENYFFEKKLVEPVVEKMLARRKRELQVAIIFVEKKSDTVPSFQKAQRLLEITRAGADFEKIARDSSEDRETGAKGGLLPFITSGRILRIVEDAAYATSAGQVYPKVVSARGGYFIVKVLKNEPRVRVRGSHILVISNSKDDSTNAGRKADSIIALLRAGQSFEKLARENSDDASSKEKGGYLGAWYIRSKGLEGASGDVLHPDFEKALYALKDGEVSAKVWTDYGVHIIRRDSTQMVNTDEEREAVKREYKRIYYEEDKRQLLDSVKTSLGWKMDAAVYASMMNAADTVRLLSDTTWHRNISAQIRQNTLYTMGNMGTITVGGFIDSTRRSEYRTVSSNRPGISRAIDKMTDIPALRIATSTLEKEYPDFAGLMREFRDGILLFKVEEQEVWSKLKFDSTAAKVYWDSTKTRYKTDLKFDISEIYVNSDSLAKTLRARLDKGEKFDALAREYTERAGYKDKAGRYGALSARENKLVAMIEKKQPMPGDIFGPESFERGYSIVRINEIVQPREKRFEEAIPDFAPIFQDQVQKKLTEQWLNKIRQNYTIKVNNSVLDKYIRKK